MKTVAGLLLGALLLAASSAHAATVIVTTGANAVTNGANFKAALDAASCGDILILQAGALYDIPGAGQPIVVPVKSCASNHVIVRSSNHALLPAGRVSPSDVSNMPTLIATQPSLAVLDFPSGADGYDFVGMHITNNLTGMTHNDITHGMVQTNYGSRNITFDRIVMHPGEHPTAATSYVTRGKFAFNISGSYLTVTNSYYL